MAVQAVLDEIQQRPGTGEVIPVIDPVAEEQITEFSDCGEEAVDEAVARAKASYQSGAWDRHPGQGTCQGDVAIADLVDERAAELDSLSTGMPVAQAKRHRLRSTDEGRRLRLLRRHARLHTQEP